MEGAELLTTPEHEGSPKLTIEEMFAGSTVKNIEVAVAMQLGKVPPLGYEQVAQAFRTQYGRTTDAHCTWFYAEAETAGKIEELMHDFPDVSNRARRILEAMKRDNPREIDSIIKRVQRPDYTIDGVRKVEQSAVQAFNIIFGKKK